MNREDITPLRMKAFAEALANFSKPARRWNASADVFGGLGETLDAVDHCLEVVNHELAQQETDTGYQWDAGKIAKAVEGMDRVMCRHPIVTDAVDFSQLETAESYLMLQDGLKKPWLRIFNQNESIHSMFSQEPIRQSAREVENGPAILSFGAAANPAGQIEEPSILSFETHAASTDKSR